MQTTARNSLLLVMLVACGRDPTRTVEDVGPCTTYEQRLADCPDDVRATLADKLAEAKRTMTDKRRLGGMCMHAIEAIRAVCPIRER